MCGLFVGPSPLNIIGTEAPGHHGERGTHLSRLQAAAWLVRVMDVTWIIVVLISSVVRADRVAIARSCHQEARTGAVIALDLAKILDVVADLVEEVWDAVAALRDV